MDGEQRQNGPELQAFLASDGSWRFTAGECNFLIQLLAYIVQSNPRFVPSDKGKLEKLNYQSIRSMVLLNEKLSQQLQTRAREASVILGPVHGGSETVQ